MSIPVTGADEIGKSNAERNGVQVFIFNDIVDLFALYGMIRLGRVVLNRRHKVGH
jgi:hypothetical protein